MSKFKYTIECINRKIDAMKHMYGPEELKEETREFRQAIKLLKGFNKLIKDLQKTIKEDKETCVEDFGKHCENEDYRNREPYDNYESIKDFVMDQDDIDCNMNYAVGDIGGAEGVLNKFISLIK